MPFGEKLQRLREQAGLSQSGLADKAGLSVRSIQNWEQGHRGPSAQAVLALAKALGIAAEDLLGELKRRGKRKGK
jgi:transcriptional regulator with XRE-family HTH domain